jgi:hypothetical protein
VRTSDPREIYLLFSSSRPVLEAVIEYQLKPDKILFLELNRTGLEAEPLLRLITRGAIGLPSLSPYAFMLWCVIDER